MDEQAKTQMCLSDAVLLVGKKLGDEKFQDMRNGSSFPMGRLTPAQVLSIVFNANDVRKVQLMLDVVEERMFRIHREDNIVESLGKER